MCRFLSLRWLLRHAAMLVLVTAFLALGWWQVSRARAGNTLSFAYAVEWPVFAAFVVGLWVREIRAELRGAESQGGARPAPEPAVRPVIVPVRPVEQPGDAGLADEDAALAAYNHYLAWLAADPQRRPSDYPRGPLRE